VTFGSYMTIGGCSGSGFLPVPLRVDGRVRFALRFFVAMMGTPLSTCRVRCSSRVQPRRAPFLRANRGEEPTPVAQREPDQYREKNPVA
jgi:hypothetical protein